MARSKHYYIRKTHRYLGVILGIQFLFWTVSGLYFSWTNIDEIHGDFEKRTPALLAADVEMVSPAIAIANLKKQYSVDSLIAIQVVNILGKPVYQVRFGQLDKIGLGHHGEQFVSKVALVNAATGELRQPLSETEAVALAKLRFNGEPVVSEIEYLQSTNPHHEYRESPLPAYAISFANEAKTTVYVSAELGTVQSFRNNKWRIFDWLWMTHTMDYEGRDDINNTLLRVFSLFGLVTVISGFVLYFISSRRFRKRRKLQATYRGANF
jgi:hypothetical protein